MNAAVEEGVCGWGGVLVFFLGAFNNLQGKEACRESVVSLTLKVLTALVNYRLSGFTDA